MSRIFSWVFGLAAVVVAAAFTFVLLDVRLTVKVALGLTAAALVVPPIVAAALLSRSLGRIDAKAGFVDNALGLAGVWAGLVAAVLLLFVRGSLADGLEASSAKHPAAPALLSRGAAALAPKLRPRPDALPNPLPSAAASHVDGGSAPSAVAVPTADAGPVAADAGRPDGASSAPSLGSEATLVADLGEIKGARRVTVADFDRDGIDEIIVQSFSLLCAEGERCVTRGIVSVIGFEKGSDRLIELFRYEPPPPAEQAPLVGVPGVGDTDGDGILDLLVCVTFTSLAGGTRGGATSIAAGRAERTFAPLTTTDRAPCAAVAMADVTGDGKAEIVILNRGNPWQAEQPKGAIAWLVRAGKAWKPGGRLAAGVDPDQADFSDLNADAMIDAVVFHGWDTDRHPLAFLGSKRGLVPAPLEVTIPSPHDPTSAVAHFDDDKRPDRVALVKDNVLDTHIRIFRTKPSGAGIVRELVRAPR